MSGLDLSDVKPIVQDDDPILKTISTPVTEFDSALNNLIVDMTKSMIVYRGIGLSAVQIGVTQRVIIVSDGEKLLHMVNPEYIRVLNRNTVEEEGCLSIPHYKWRKVSRPAKCEVRWQDMNGDVHTGNFSGMTARIIQHEMDHLDGILITDKPPVR